MSKFSTNGFNTTQLVLNVMSRCAAATNQDIHDDEVSNSLYWTCCDLESWPEDQGFGSSDINCYIRRAEKEAL